LAKFRTKKTHCFLRTIAILATNIKFFKKTLFLLLPFENNIIVAFYFVVQTALRARELSPSLQGFWEGRKSAALCCWWSCGDGNGVDELLEIAARKF
jgi:hypothetical protein